VRVDEDPLAVAWFPESLRDHLFQKVEAGDSATAIAELRNNWRYVFIEEVAAGIAEVHSWPWPLVDQTGRLTWPDTDAELVEVQAVPCDELQQRVYAPDLVRQPRAGDAFAVRQPMPRHAQSPGDDTLRSVLGGEILDISPDARHAAKVSYYGSSAAIFHEDAAVTDLLQEATRQREAERPAVALVIEQPFAAEQGSSEDRS
jgi:hypothetical protein